ncbi:hypothetical protein E2C01_016887 [Portunus trituberculatus]|uniref:Uncharacterized protein n=1 Tax=Portunus trituberculatus TaxID=210409 RepID=A0A5B7DQ99_PORTR|nr:hypothetical protein [Portunus trituberculatus]
MSAQGRGNNEMSDAYLPGGEGKSELIIVGNKTQLLEARPVPGWPVIRGCQHLLLTRVSSASLSLVCIVWDVAELQISDDHLLRQRILALNKERSSLALLTSSSRQRPLLSRPAGSCA